MENYRTKLSDRSWKAKFGSITYDEFIDVFGLIKDHFQTPRSTDLMNRNKFVMFIHFFHCKALSWDTLSSMYYHIPISSCRKYIDQVLVAMESYFGDSWIQFPMDNELRSKMISILEFRGEPMADALFLIDGKCTRFPGKSRKHNKCWKFKFRGGRNILHVIDRVFGLVCCLSVADGSTHDFRVFKETQLFSNLKYYLGNAQMLADTAYFWRDATYQQSVCALPSVKKHKTEYEAHDESTWELHKTVRSAIERKFAIEYSTQWKGLNDFNGRGTSGEKKHALATKCIMSMTNYLRLKRVRNMPVDKTLFPFIPSFLKEFAL